MSAGREAASSRLEKNLSIVQELAMLGWMMKGEEAKVGVETATGLHVLLELWNRVTQQEDIKRLRENTLMSIVEYVKMNPQASEDVLRREVLRRIESFAVQVSSL